MHYGRYETVRELGKGSMGVVYQAHDPQIDRTVALKVLRQDRNTSEAFVRRFIKEAKAIGRLSHPNIVTVYDAGEDQGTIYIAMEFLEGRPLNELIQERQFNFDEILSIGIQVAETLDYAHGKGVVHRDIKPSNIVIQPKGLVKITDFGIAHIEDPSATLQTQDGEILGTPAYMSPEQVLGRTVDGRSDLFSLGVILYELSTGKRPFGREGKTLATLFNEIVHSHPVEPAQVNADLDPRLSGIIMKCLSKEPGERYPSGDAVAGALRDCLRHEQSSEATVIAPPPPAVQKKKGKTHVPLLALLLLVILAGSAYFMVPGVLDDARQKLEQMFRAKPPPQAMALLQLKSSPPEARVTINGESRGRTPLELELPPGRYAVKASLPGHGDWAGEVSLDEARPYPVQMELRRLAELAFVKFESKPPGAQVFVNGAPEGKTPVGLELPLGDHTVRLVLSGFKDWEQRISLHESKEYPVSADMAPVAEARLATLKVDTAPAGVAIYVDDEMRGRSPIEVSLPLGKHLVRMRQDGYMDWVDVVQLNEEKGYPLQVELKPVKVQADLNVTTIPQGADVSVDGKLEGKSPIVVKLPSGRRSVRISLDGYQEWTDVVLLEDGKETPLEVTLKEMVREPELIVSSNPQGAEVSVDGALKGMTPLRVKVVPGRHTVRLVLADHQDWEGRVQMEQGKEQLLNVDLKQLSKDALLSVSSEPPQARVFVNGIARGETPLQLKLPPGKHNVRVTLAKFRNWESQVLLKVAEEYPLSVRLVPEPPKRQPIARPKPPTTESASGRTQPKPPTSEDWGVGEWRSRRVNQGQ